MALETISSDWSYFQNGPYAVCNNVWNKREYQNGIDFTQQITYDPTALHRGTTISWSWPAGPSWDVVSYPELIVGYKPWGEIGEGSMSSTIAAMSNLKVKYSLSLLGDGQHNNIAFEMWLTDEKLGDEASITTEVMIWVHSGIMTPPGEVVGTFSFGGHAATVYTVGTWPPTAEVTEFDWRYIAVDFHDQYLRGTIDVKQILNVLVRKGLVDETDYVNGFELGAEVNGGTDGFTINSLSYQFSDAERPENSVHSYHRNDRLVGTDESDLMLSRRGNDRLLGGHGDDWLNGGRGQDVLRGGAGSDMFIFRSLNSGDSDFIGDFTRGEDKIVLLESVFRSLDLGDLSRAAFAERGDETMATRLIFDSANNKLFYDRDGSRTDHDRVLIATFTDIDLSHSDILVM